MMYVDIDTAWQLAADRRSQLMDAMPRRRRRPAAPQAVTARPPAPASNRVGSRPGAGVDPAHNARWRGSRPDPGSTAA